MVVVFRQQFQPRPTVRDLRSAGFAKKLDCLRDLVRIFVEFIRDITDQTALCETPLDDISVCHILTS